MKELAADRPDPPLETLRKLGDSYRRRAQERERPSSSSAVQRRLANEMQTLEDRFERLLVEWVTEHTLRARWRAFLRGRATAPDLPRLATPLPMGAARAGATSVAAPAPGARNFCVVVAGAARARVLMLEPVPGGDRTAAPELIEVAEITNPMLRARTSGGASEGTTGRRGSGKAPVHAAPEARDPRRRDIERHFAAEIAEEAAGAWRLRPSCELIIVASAWMLDLLRHAIEQKLGPGDRVGVHELPRDLTKVAAAKLHDELAAAGLLPARGGATTPRAPPDLPVRA